MFDTANFSYILPTHRATIYVIGILLAYLLRNKTLTMNKVRINSRDAKHLVNLEV